MNETEEIQKVSGQIVALFEFCKELIPHIDLLEKAHQQATDKENFAVAAAPVLLALGKDFEQVELEAWLRKERVSALIKLLRILKETEEKRATFYFSKAENTRKALQVLGEIH